MFNVGCNVHALIVREDWFKFTFNWIKF